MRSSSSQLVIPSRSSRRGLLLESPPRRSGSTSSTRLRRDRGSGRNLDRSHLRTIGAGAERICTPVAGLVDTNILIYRFDPRFPEKQTRADELLREGIMDETIVVPHQAIIEFVAAATKPIAGGGQLLSVEEALREAEDLMNQFRVVYPTEGTVRAAFLGVMLYQLSWFDAHLWAYADERGLDTLWTEDFQHGRRYGGVRTIDPFQTSPDH
ncbi:MAG: PIN domain-containing protein [Acidimicrobiia bacterium]|nr:PIN domain-containing protein [Acidimicrobiia bacterium]